MSFGFGFAFTRPQRVGGVSPPAPGPPWIVLDSTATSYVVTNTVEDSAGTPYTVSATVLASDGTPYNPI